MAFDDKKEYKEFYLPPRTLGIVTVPAIGRRACASSDGPATVAAMETYAKGQGYELDFSAPETAVMGVAIHAFEWGFVRLAPFALIAALMGVFLTRKKAG